MEQLDFLNRLNEKLDIFSSSDQSLRVWWRDDDAIEGSPALKKLTNLSEQLEIPLYLAVIPGALKSSFNLKNTKHITLLLHGFRHQNRAHPGNKKCEFPEHLSSEKVLGELEQGCKKLQAHFGEAFEPVFVPPWNRFAKKFEPLLKKASLHTLSSFGKAPHSLFTNTHFDMIDWKRSRDFIGWEKAWDQLDPLLDERLQSSEPLGVLTHHLVHTSKIWSFLDVFLKTLNSHPCVQFIDRASLFPNSSS